MGSATKGCVVSVEPFIFKPPLLQTRFVNPGSSSWTATPRAKPRVLVSPGVLLVVPSGRRTVMLAGSGLHRSREPRPAIHPVFGGLSNYLEPKSM